MLAQKAKEAKVKLQTRLAELQKSKSVLEESSKSAQNPWRDLAQAMFNLKEFIYLQ